MLRITKINNIDDTDNKYSHRAKEQKSGTENKRAHWHLGKEKEMQFADEESP